MDNLDAILILLTIIVAIVGYLYTKIATCYPEESFLRYFWNVFGKLLVIYSLLAAVVLFGYFGVQRFLPSEATVVAKISTPTN